MQVLQRADGVLYCTAVSSNGNRGLRLCVRVRGPEEEEAVGLLTGRVEMGLTGWVLKWGLFGWVVVGFSSSWVGAGCVD